MALLDIHSEIVTHTSDYFDELYELALQIIKSGKAYADDTEQIQVTHCPRLNLCLRLISTFYRCVTSVSRALLQGTGTTVSKIISSTSLK